MSFAIMLGGMLAWRLSLCLSRIVQQRVYSQTMTRMNWAAISAACLTAVVYLAGPYILTRLANWRRDQALSVLARCHLPLYLYLVLAFEGSQPRIGAFMPWLHGLVFGAVVCCAGVAFWGNAFAQTWRKSAWAGSISSFLGGKTAGARWGNWAVVVLIAVIFYLSSWDHHSRRVRFDDGCEFGGDVWEYQSIGANFALGHGFPTFGGQEDFQAYRFGRGQDQADPKLVKRFYDEATAPGRYFYRTPGYPLFLGLVYRLGHVSPLLAKMVQLRLLVIVAAVLPVLGFAFWRWHGCLAGVLAGHFYLSFYRGLAGMLITENLVTVWVLLLIAALALWHRRQGWWQSGFLGVVLGTSLLVKGWFVLMPALWAIHAAWGVWRRREPVRQAVLVVLVMVLTIAPWSTYASARSGQFILLATQGKNVLLQGNNEDVERTGGWHRDGPMKPESFYQREGVDALSGTIQVALFYADSPAKFPLIMMQKLRAAFGQFVFWKYAILLMALDMFGCVWRHLGASAGIRSFARAGLMAVPFAFAFAAVGLLETVLHIGVPRFLPQDPNYAWWLLLFGVALTAVTGAPWRLLPAALAIVLLNFVLMTFLVFGLQRFIWPLEFVSILIAVRYGLCFAGQALGALLAGDVKAGLGNPL